MLYHWKGLQNLHVNLSIAFFNICIQICIEVIHDSSLFILILRSLAIILIFIANYKKKKKNIWRTVTFVFPCQ